jgi:hypothetical protein
LEIAASSGGNESSVSLAWLEKALEHAYAHGQIKTLAYLEALMEDVVFVRRWPPRGRPLPMGRGVPFLDSAKHLAQRGLDHCP